MNFKEFFELTRPVIGGKGGAHKFARTLFDAIITEEGADVLDDYSENTYKAYANGRTQITEIAKAISPHIDQEEFVTFIDQFGDAVQLALCERFEPYIPEINACNVGTELADLFANIIWDAAGTKRKGPASPRSDAEPIETEVVDDNQPSGAVSEDKKITVIHQQTNVVQNGENNFNLTNNGVMNFNFGGGES